MCVSLLQGVTNLMWALATMGAPPDAALVHAMGERAMDLVDDFNAQVPKLSGYEHLRVEGS